MIGPPGRHHSSASDAGSRFRRLSIRWKLASYLLLAALLPLVAVTTWNIAQARRTLLALADQFLLANAQETAEAIETYLRERRLDVQQMALGPLVIRSITEGARETDAERDLVRSRFEGDRRIGGHPRVALLRADGEPIVAAGEPIPTEGPESERALRGALAGSPAVSDPFFAGPDGPYVLEFAVPVRDRAGSVRGAILAALPFDHITAIVKAHNARAGPDSVGVLVDEHTVRIAHGWDPALVGRPIVPLPTLVLQGQVRSQRFGRRSADLLGGPTGHGNFADRLAALRQNPRGSPFFDATHPATGKWSRSAVVQLWSKAWAYAISTPHEVLLAPARAQLRGALLAMAATAVAAALLAFGVGGLLAGRVASLSDAAGAIARGEFSARAVEGPGDEIGRVARSFNRMAQALQEHEAASRERVARLEAPMDIGRAVTGTLDLDQVLSLVVEKSVEGMGVHAAAIHAVDPSSNLRTVKGHGLSAEYVSTYRLRPGEGVSGAALRDGRPASTEDIQEDHRFVFSEERRGRLAAEGIRAALCVPIVPPSGPYGVLALYRRDAGAFDPDQVRFATLLGAHAAIAAEDLPHPLDPFFSTKGERGTGLGLPICLSLVEQHGGTLEVQSPGPGRGTTATVRLPAPA